jgi:uncharacterized HhH-GPD family protein
MSMSPPSSLPFTGDPEADALIAREPLALLIGFVLDQQITLQKAFSGPLELQRRVGTIDAAALAGMDPADLDEAFRTRPALHRFPGNMAKRTQALCLAVVETYHGDASLVWTEAKDGKDLETRLLALPGIGDMKAKTLIAILVNRFGFDLPGIDDVKPGYPTLGDVDSAEELAEYQEMKRAYKLQLKAEGGSFDPESAKAKS